MPKYILIIFREFFEICLFRKRPQDLPAAGELCWLVIILYTLFSSVLSYPAQSIPIALLTGCIESVMLLMITYLFLYLRSVPGRWLQTSIALAGTGVIFSVLAFPLFYLRVYVQGGPSLQSFIALLIVFLVLWNIAVMSHILKNALSSSYLLAVPGALTYIAIITLTLQLLIPALEA